MSVKTVDCRGLACPQPVIETKKALEGESGSTILSIVDNEVARENVSRFARNAGLHVEIEKKEGYYHLTISGREGGDPGAGFIAEETPGCKVAAGVVYFITTNTLGQGSPDLGAVLIRSLMVTLSEQQPPEALLLLNTGVYLAVEGSPVLEQLQKLSGEGTKILVCGTCLGYYKLKERLAVGVVSNMYEINNHLTGPHKVITVG